MISAAILAASSFVIIFLGLRLLEFVYHYVRRTPDWSPHWGSWVFAVLAALFIFAANLGR